MITFDGKDLIVRPPRYPSHEVKEILGARWDTRESAWRLPPLSLNVLKLVEWYGDGILKDAPDSVVHLVHEPWGFCGFQPDELKEAVRHTSWNDLYDFQQEGVEYLFCNPHGAALVNLSWGMGKSAVSVVSADLLEAKRILVLAPLTLAPAWIGEFERWSSTTRDIKRSKAGDRTPGPEVTIANHEVIQETVLRDEDGKIFQPDWVTNARTVKAWRDEGPIKENAKGKIVPIRERITRVRRDYLEIEWDLIIVDESVLLKNRKAVKLDVLGQLRRAYNPFMFLLSGSPITKFRDDLYAQMKTLVPRGFPSYWRFAEFFCIVDKGGWGWTIEGDNPEHDPQSFLRDLLWVKSQDEALPDLPEYIEQPIPIEPTTAQARALESMVKDWIVELEGDPHAKVEASNWLARNTRLQQITSNMGSLPKPHEDDKFFPASGAKTDLLVQLLEDEEIETPLLVWTWYVETTAEVERRVRKARPDLTVGSVVGSDSSHHKDSTIAGFKDGTIDVLILQMSTGKFGLTFTKTKTVFYHDRSFDSDAFVQSLARVRRIGLKHRPVLIVPKVLGSADQLIDLNLSGKLTSMARLTNSDLARLLRTVHT